MSDYERIWLEPKCCYSDYEGRHWCQDADVFQHNGDPDDAEHSKPTEYVRADLFAELEAQLKAVQEYTSHEPRCKYLFKTIDGGIGKCTCGLAAALQQGNDDDSK